jgi:beta-N-acetylhexosaminidase
VVGGTVLVLALGTAPPALTPEGSAASAPGTAASRCTDLGSWSLHRLAEQTVVVPVEETGVSAADREVAAGAGAVILFGSRAPLDLRQRLASLSALAPGGIRPLVMTDEEGGTVQRMANLVGNVPSARTMGSTMTPRHIRRIARRLGTRMAANGVGMDLAPVLDLDARAGPDDHDAIGTRSFSARRGVATRAGLAFARGLLAGGVVPVVKHFPGLGSADANTDLGPADTKPWRLLQSDDLLPFGAAVDAGMPVVMVSNARIPGLTRLPAALSSAVVHRVLRGRLGFRGLVLPDSLTAGALTAAGFGLTRAAVQGLVVGEDMVLFNASAATLATTTSRVVGAVVTAVSSGHLTRTRLESAVRHVLHVKHVAVCSG